MAEELSLPVDQIGWSQDSIASTFRNGDSLHSVINRLRGATQQEVLAFFAEFPPIRLVCFERQGWITLDNRRLYLMRQLLNPGTVIRAVQATAAEADELRRKLTTGDEGATITIRR